MEAVGYGKMSHRLGRHGTLLSQMRIHVNTVGKELHVKAAKPQRQFLALALIVILLNFGYRVTI
jgi:hypothetical protein